MSSDGESFRQNARRRAPEWVQAPSHDDAPNDTEHNLPVSNCGYTWDCIAQQIVALARTHANIRPSLRNINQPRHEQEIAESQIECAEQLAEAKQRIAELEATVANYQALEASGRCQDPRTVTSPHSEQVVSEQRADVTRQTVAILTDDEDDFEFFD